MPVKQAAKKYVRITARKTAKNNKIKGAFRSAIKKTREAITKGDANVAKEELKRAIKAIDKATQKKVLHKKTAARKKSRLNKAVKAIVKK